MLSNTPHFTPNMNPKCEPSNQTWTEYLQRVKWAKTLEGVRGQCWYLVVAQVSVINKTKCVKGKRNRNEGSSREQNKVDGEEKHQQICSWQALLTSCAASCKEKRPQLGSPWWRSAPVVWNQINTHWGETVTFKVLDSRWLYCHSHHTWHMRWNETVH